VSARLSGLIHPPQCLQNRTGVSVTLLRTLTSLFAGKIATACRGRSTGPCFDIERKHPLLRHLYAKDAAEQGGQSTEEVSVPRKLEHFPEPGGSRYPWNQLLDGSTWELVKGEDFASRPQTIISSARAQARRRGGSVRTRLFVEPDRTAIVLQFQQGAGK